MEQKQKIDYKVCADPSILTFLFVCLQQRNNFILHAMPLQSYTRQTLNHQELCVLTRYIVDF